MHIRFSIAVGMPVLDDETSRIVARISGILIHPDTGKIAGFFVSVAGLFSSNEFFLSSQDIVAWGTVVHVRHQDVIVPADELVRLKPLLEDGRTMLGQRILTAKKRRYMGICKDVQFDTRQLAIEWLFPRKYFFLSQNPIPASEVTEVTKKAILVKEPLRPKKVPVQPVLPTAQQLNDVLPAAPTPS